MGDVADMMLDGTMCEGCGVFMDGEAPDYPRLCKGCAKDRRKMGHIVEPNGEFWIDCGPPTNRKLKAMPQAKLSCPVCQKRVKATGVKDHMRDVHGPKAAV